MMANGMSTEALGVTVCGVSQSGAENIVERRTKVQAMKRQLLEQLALGCETHAPRNDFQRRVVGKRQTSCAPDRETKIVIEF